MRELVEAFDFDGAADILKMIGEYRLQKPVQDKIAMLHEQITRLDRDAVLETLG